MRKMTFPTLEQISLTSVLYALSDPTRLQIVKSLAEKEEMTCCSFVFKSAIAKSTLSHHFKVLRDAGVILTRAEGTQGINSLRKQDLDQRFPGMLDAILRVTD
ncbi:helix-turn-helix transcriptional regulator [Synechococcus sp. PCC 7502]|uniref:ArsR/SmtB family transcription factor n=1 Tax=Synechococcus sp. PCC 7502 TaxID=1173263 RepID=UPI00059CE6DB|nr:helix-turn-helix transcriptional regulator [Synechococcus sp. PCC 7502]